MKIYKGFFVGCVGLFSLFLTAGVSFSYTISASADGAGGTISPAGAVTVAPGASQTFTVTPEGDFDIFDVVVDSVSVGQTSSYTFSDVSTDHTISASFSACADPSSVMLENDGSFFNTVMDAYYAAIGSGMYDFTIKLRAGTLPDEDLYFNENASVRLDGGYDCLFVDKYMGTKIPGSLTIAGGSVIPSDIAISSPPPCAPNDPLNFPGNPEICDGLDNNCNGLVDDGLTFDLDGDGHTSLDSCQGTADDCDDNDPYNFPGNIETCDGYDNNCNGQIDEGLPTVDADGDGYSAIGSCGGSADDCNDNDPSIHPGAQESYPADGIDQNCDGQDLVAPIDAQCGNCHGLNVINSIHSTTVAAPDGSCQGCHSSQLSSVLYSHYGKTVRTAGNNLAAGAVISCTSCHDWHDVNNYPTGVYTNFVWAKVTSATNLTCDTCHENRAAAHDAAHNNRVILDLCSHCHTSDTTTLGQPGSGSLTSNADVDTLHRSDCTTCHGYTVASSPNSPDPAVVAQAISDGIDGAQIDCLVCHGDAFPTIHAFLEGHYNLIRVGDTGCANCHQDAPPLVDNTNPKVHQACTNCHDAEFNTISYAAGKHFADYESPNPPGDCTVCHIIPFGDIHTPDIDHIDHSNLVTTNGAYCANCHTSTAFIDPNDPKVHNGCSTCHDDQGNLISLAAGKSLATGGNCITCHGDDFTTIHPDTVDHSGLIKVDSTGCANCHSDPPPLVDPGNPKVHNACSTCHASNGDRISLAAGKSFAQDGNCTTCHTISFSDIHPPTIDHSNLVTTNGAYCANCHTSTAFIDPNDPKVHDGCFNCHDSQGRLISLAAGKSLVTGGNCITCHGDEFTTIHPDTVDHSGLIKVGTTGCGNCHSNPPPLVDPNNPKVHNACSTCHASNGDRISYAAGKTFSQDGDCTTCHTIPFGEIHPPTIDHSNLVTTSGIYCSRCHNDPPPLVDPNDLKVHNACSTCHDDQGNLISLAAGKSMAVGGNCGTCHGDIFTSIHPDTVDHSQAIQVSTDCGVCHTSTALVDPNDPTVHNACTTCHNSDGTLHDLAAGNPAPNECITCHGSDVSEAHSLLHVASPGSDYVVLWVAGSHDDALVGDGKAYVACQNCHNTQAIGVLHVNQCSLCHPSPVDTLNNAYAGGCQQGGCHTTYHARATDGHSTVSDQCNKCHTNVDMSLVTADACANCHATFDAADTTPPVTTSDAQSSYTGAALIHFTRRQLGMVDVGFTFYQLDGGATQRGLDALVTSTGTHTLTFWSVDQVGNVESPANTATFTIAEDTVAPTTTSNAHATYYSPANITFTATDNGSVAPTTYYTINGGPTQSGTSVYIPLQPGTFNYTLQFWSEDWSGNVEAMHTVNFTVIGGTGTLRLVWGSSDVNGSPCDLDPEAKANWTVQNGIVPVTSGAASCSDPGGWSGVNDIAVQVSGTPYSVTVNWWNSDGQWWESTDFNNINVTSDGQVERLAY